MQVSAFCRKKHIAAVVLQVIYIGATDRCYVVPWFVWESTYQFCNGHVMQVQFIVCLASFFFVFASDAWTHTNKNSTRSNPTSLCWSLFCCKISITNVVMVCTAQLAFRVFSASVTDHMQAIKQLGHACASPKNQQIHKSQCKFVPIPLAAKFYQCCLSQKNQWQKKQQMHPILHEFVPIPLAVKFLQCCLVTKI